MFTTALAANAILAKSRAMYGRRLTAKNYGDLLNCHTVAEVAAYLKSRTDYASALESVSPQTVHRQQLESLLEKRLFEQYAALCRYEMDIGHDFYRYFILKVDVKEILACLRYLNAGVAGEYLYALPGFMQKHSQVDFYRLASARTLPELVAALEGTPYQKLLRPFAENPEFDLEQDGTLEIEAVFSAYLYSALQEIASTKLQGSDMQDVLALLRRRCDLEAIVDIYRLKRVLKADRLFIKKRISTTMTNLSKRQLDGLLDAADAEEFKRRLRETPYGKELARTAYDYIEEGVRKINYRWHLKQLRFSTNPSVVLFCYIFLAENEVTNITHLVEGIRYKMPPEEISQLLVGAE